MSLSSIYAARRRYGQKRCLAVLFAFFVFVAGPTHSSAHQKWLWPNTFVVTKSSSWISVDATWSDTPFTAESGLGKQKLRVVPPRGKASFPTKVFVGKVKTTFEVELKEEGTFRLDAIDPPTYWTQVVRDKKKVWIRKPKQEVAGEQIVRSDLYWSIASAYVTSGNSHGKFPKTPLDPLSLIPSVHPNSVTVESPFLLEVVSKGKPVPGVVVKSYSMESTGHKPVEVVSANDQGVCTFHPNQAGLYLFACEWEHKRPEDDVAELHSYNAYLTIKVLPESSHLAPPEKGKKSR